jgi:hypothetical protein
MNSQIEMFLGKHFKTIVLIVIASALFTFASIKETFRLRPEMPQQFIDTSVPTQRPAEERIARAYWDCTTLHIQGKYVHEQRLPEEPPSEFAIALPDPGQDTPDPSSRIRYWRRLRSVWTAPESWHKTYEWDFNWVTEWTEATQRWLNNHVPGLNNNSAT